MDELVFFLLLGVLVVGGMIASAMYSEHLQSENLKACVAAGKTYDSSSGDCE